MEFLKSDMFQGMLITVVLCILGGWLIQVLIFYLLKKTNILRAPDNFPDVKERLKGPVRLFFILLLLYLGFPFYSMGENLGHTLKTILKIAWIFVFCWLCWNVIIAGRIIVIQKYDISEKDNLRARKVYTKVTMLENILKFLLVLVGAAFILMTFEPVRKIGLSLLTSAGIAGIILGFAAQKMIATIIGGIQLAFTQPIRIDDVVIVEGEWGRIEEINLTYVVVRIWDDRRLVLPTTYFIETPFQNWTRTTSQLLGTVFIDVDFRVSIDGIREELTRLLENTDLWDGRVNVVQVTGLKEGRVEVRLLVSAEDAAIAWDLRVYIREGMMKYLKDNYPDSLPVVRLKMEETDYNGDNSRHREITAIE